MNEICVAHLVRAQNGIGPLIDFLESYKLNPGGIEHDFIILFKGFKNEGPSQEYRSLLRPFNYKELHVPDEGFDITAYFAVPRSFQYKYYCFLNSFSVILDAKWLLKMHQYISQENVGLVGATGSYQGHLWRGNYTYTQWKLSVENAIPKSKHPKLRKFWVGRLDWALQFWISYLNNGLKLNFYFPRFPNFHIRSNAFMLRDEMMRKIVCPKILSKMDAYKCESGRQSITNQIMKLGKIALVIGKDGKAYKKEDWWKSNTFWRENQENLLVSDNQTRAYTDGGLAQKTLFSNYAWGENASPKQPFKN